MVVASYGGGVNSTAMLIGMWEQQEKVDLILFADTGGEKPHTYRHVSAFSEWLVSHGFPSITTVRAPNETLEESCVKLHCLPSVAYGFRTCSQRFKIQPQVKFLKQFYQKEIEDDGIIRLIGFDAGEPWRAEGHPENRYPLIEWGWNRAECVNAIDRIGLEQPGKSSCFFCPNSKKKEILELRRVYPELAQRAVAMEKNAQLTEIVGLGRSYAWGDLYTADDAQRKLFEDLEFSRCDVCYDG